MNSQNEVWKPVSECPDCYEVSSVGRIRRTKNPYGGKPRILKQTLNAHRGYMEVSLWVRGERRQRRVHVLVAEAFLEPRPSPKHGTNHINGVKTDNRSCNLEWATQAQNVQHAYDIGLTNQKCRITRRHVDQIMTLARAGVPHSAISKRVGFSPSVISGVRNGKYPKWWRRERMTRPEGVA